MRWHSRYETGDASIDQQHKTLFETTDQYRKTLEAGVGEKTYDLFLEALTAFVEMHFVYEEKCMFFHRCPAAGRNKIEHEHFKKRVYQENDRFAAEGFVRHEAKSMVDMIEDWLESHIGRIDVQLKDCFDRT